MPYAMLFYACSFSGIIMIASAVWLLFKEKIFLDAHTKQVLYVQLPFVGKVQTNAPTIFLIVLGFLAIGYPVYLSKTTVTGTRYLWVKQRISSEVHPVTVYIAVRDQILPQDGTLELPLPALSDQSYSPQLIYVTGSITSFNQPVNLNEEKRGVINLEAISLQTKNAQPQMPLAKPDVTSKPSNFQ